jgi:HEAT repeat protein
MLDVTLSSKHKALTFPLIDPQLNRTQRIQQLEKIVEAPSLAPETGRDEILNDLIQDPNRSWAESWTRACAIYAATQLGVTGTVPAVEAALADPDPSVRETAIWSLKALDPERFALHCDILTVDEDPQVARQAIQLREN